MSLFSKEELNEIKGLISPANIISLLDELGGDPRYLNDNTIISRTICHDGDSKKLYYYVETKTFHCYTNCGTFDIFQLVRKVFNMEFTPSVYYIINKFNIPFDVSFDSFSSYSQNRKAEEDYFKSKKIIKEQVDTSFSSNYTVLKEYDDTILSRFMYPVISPWEREGIAREIIEKAKIGYYPGGGQITIPHYDINNRLIGIRGRQLGKEEADLFGKYRPLYINKILYSHPLGFNLYNLNNSKENIKNIQKAFVFESEKSTLMYRSYFGIENDISVACCGSSLSDYQVQLLIDAGAREIIVAFDRQFQEIDDDEFTKLVKKLTALNKRYKKIVGISFIFDKNKITSYKSSPIDEGPMKFLELYKERIIL